MLKFFSQKNKKGFTLIELLVVIAIIGLLSSIILVSLGPARAKARDTKRMSEIRGISSAMEMCFADATSPDCGGADNYPAIAVDTNNRISTIGTVTGRIGPAASPYMSPLPTDPGGGTQTSCITAAGAMSTPGLYCAFASSAGGAYCIFAKLEDGRIVAASEKGVRFYTPTVFPLTEGDVCP